MSIAHDFFLRFSTADWVHSMNSRLWAMQAEQHRKRVDLRFAIPHVASRCNFDLTCIRCFCPLNEICWIAGNTKLKFFRFVFHTRNFFLCQIRIDKIDCWNRREQLSQISELKNLKFINDFKNAQFTSNSYLSRKWCDESCESHFNIIFADSSVCSTV